MDLKNIEFTREQLSIIDDFCKFYPEANRDLAIRFCLGRKFVKARIYECYVAYKRTVAQYNFQNISIFQVLPELRTQKMFIPGTRDRNGAALLVINAARHRPGEFTNEETLKLAFYLAEILTKNFKTAKIGITLIFNMECIEWATLDIRFQRIIIDLFQNNIPARVRNILLYRCPWWITSLIRIISPFLKEKIRSRIKICNKIELQDFVSPNQLPVTLGGEFEYDHGEWICRETAKIKGEKNPKELEIDRGNDESRISTQMGSENDQLFGENKAETVIGFLPIGTTLLVSSDNVAAQLSHERERILQELDLKIQNRKQYMILNSMPLDITKMIRSRSLRISFDLTHLPMIQANNCNKHNLSESLPEAAINNNLPVSEVTGENYDPEVLQSRILESIEKDRNDYIQTLNIKNDEKVENKSLSEVHSSIVDDVTSPMDLIQCEKGCSLTNEIHCVQNINNHQVDLTKSLVENEDLDKMFVVTSPVPKIDKNLKYCKQFLESSSEPSVITSKPRTPRHRSINALPLHDS